MKKYYAFASKELHPDFVSTEVMKKIGADYSHCGIIEEDSSGTLLVFQATGEGFHSMEMGKFLEKREIKIKTPLYLGVHPEFAAGWLRGNIGKEYAASQYIGFLIPRLKKFVANKDEKVICSESLYYFMVTCCGLPHDHEGDFVDPKEAMALAEKVRL